MKEKLMMCRQSDMVHQFASECVSTSIGDNGIFSVENKVIQAHKCLGQIGYNMSPQFSPCH